MPLVSAVTAVVLYLLATGLLLRGSMRGDEGRGWVPVAVLALVFHAEYHVEAWKLAQGPDMHLFAALSLVALGMALLVTVTGAFGRMAALGLVVFPIAALSVLGYAAYGHVHAETLDWRMQLHAWCALLAYATLAVAALLAVMSWVQERALRRHELRRWLRLLPPLTELETLLFRTIAVGFILLSATLLTGVLFVQNLLAQHLVHKTVLSVMSWLLFGWLLFARWRYGWRGPKAVAWTIVAMALLVLAFFGSKFVLEMVLHRSLDTV